MTTTTPPAISRFPVPELASLPDDIRSRIEAVQEKSGFIPNVFLVMAHRPDEFRAFMAYHDALMDKPGGLSKAEREMIVEYDHPQVGRVRMPGNPIKFEGAGKTISNPAPLLGEHTDAVLRELLSLSAQRIAELRQQGVVK